MKLILPATDLLLEQDAAHLVNTAILTSANRNGAVLRRGEEIVGGGPPAPPFP